MRILELKGRYKVEDLEQLCEKAVNKRTAQRLEAICLRARGKSPGEIANILGRSPKTIRNWIKMFNAGGPESLEYKHTGGRTGKLSPEQEERLFLYLREGKPDDRPWTLKALSEKLLEDFGIQLSKQQVNERVKRYKLSASLQNKQRDRKQKDRPDQRRID